MARRLPLEVVAGEGGRTVTLAAGKLDDTGATPAPEVQQPKTVLDFDPPIAHFLINLGAIDLVERIAFRTCSRQMDVWVMLRERSLAAEEHVFRLDYEYRKAGGRADIELRVVSLDRTDPSLLPEPDFVVERNKGRCPRAPSTSTRRAGTSRPSSTC